MGLIESSPWDLACGTNGALPTGGWMDTRRVVRMGAVGRIRRSQGRVDEWVVVQTDGQMDKMSRLAGRMRAFFGNSKAGVGGSRRNVQSLGLL